MPKAYAATSLIYSLGTAAIAVTLIVYFELGVLGYIIGQTAGSVAALLAGILFARSCVPVSLVFDRDALKEMISFSGPLVLSSAAVYFNMYTDRWMLRAWSGLDEVGLYAVAFHIAAVVGMVVLAFGKALTPMVYQNYRSADTAHNVSKIFEYFLVLTLILVSFISLFAHELIQILTGPGYEAAEQVIGILAISAMLMGIYVFAPGLGIAKKTKTIAKINILAASVNIILNAILIPKFGMQGAAVATLCGGFTMASLYFMLGSKEYPIPYRPSRCLIAALLFSSIYLLVSLLAIELHIRLLMWLIFSVAILFILINKTSLRPVSENKRSPI